MKSKPRSARRWAGALLLALAPACADQGGPVAPPDAVSPGPTELLRLECRVDVPKREVLCGDGLAGDARELIVGGQNVYTKVTTTNVSWAADTFRFDLTVKNLIPQPMGTLDGTTPHADGVRVFYSSGPMVTSGSGVITVVNADGVGTFTAANQPYYQYSGALLGSDGILSTNETSSARPWLMHMPSTVVNFSFTLLISTEVPYPNGWVDVTGTPRVLVGGTRALTATPRSNVGNATGEAVTWSSLNPAVATVDPNTGGVTGVAPGMATITATSTTVPSRTGSLAVQVCEDFALAVGGVRHLTMSGSVSFCLGGGASGAEYTVVPVNLESGPSVFVARAEGIVPAFGPPNPARLPGAGAGGARAFRGSTREADGAFEPRLRERERRELAGLFRAARGGAGAAVRPRPRWSIVPGEPVVGDLMQLNVEAGNSCSTADLRTGRVEVVGTHVVVLADTGNPAGGFTTTDYQEIAARFDDLVWPTLTGTFGAPGDEDGNERVVLFFTRAVNEDTPAGAAYLGGYFLARDLFSAFSCPTSNVGELIYLAVPDPSGVVNGNARGVEFVKHRVAVTAGHELQHLVNASRRLYVNFAPGFEEVWLNEGLSSVAEELLFYAASGKSPRQNLAFAGVADGGVVQDAFLTYAEPGYARLREWLRAPNLGDPLEEMALRGGGGGWALLRYAADRVAGGGGSEPAFWSALANSTTSGMANLQAALGTDPRPWIRDFAVAMYSDDAVPGAAAEHTQPSWNFRSLYGALDYDGNMLADGYPLAARNPAPGVAEMFALFPGGGTAYLRMGVAAGEVAGVSLSWGGASFETLHVSVIRRK